MASTEKVRSAGGSPLELAANWLAAGKPQDVCPVSATGGQKVKQVTLGNHLRPDHWRWVWEDGFYFCSAPACPVVYFHNGQRVYFTQDDVRTRVGIKAGSSPVPVCYCMNVTEERIIEEIQVKRCCTSLEDIKNYTRARTGKLCHVTNPSGKCCGKHLTAVVERALAAVSDPALAKQARETCCQIPED